jgi:hypothetical protein
MEDGVRISQVGRHGTPVSQKYNAPFLNVL